MNVVALPFPAEPNKPTRFCLFLCLNNNRPRLLLLFHVADVTRSADSRTLLQMIEILSAFPVLSKINKSTLGFKSSHAPTLPCSPSQSISLGRQPYHAKLHSYRVSRSGNLPQPDPSYRVPSLYVVYKIAPYKKKLHSLPTLEENDMRKKSSKEEKRQMEKKFGAER